MTVKSLPSVTVEVQCKLSAQTYLLLGTEKPIAVLFYVRLKADSNLHLIYL